jgi:iron complex outermembrane receptor protein
LKTVEINFPSAQNKLLEIFLEPEVEETENVIVTATRSSRTISDNPTRVEVIAGEEINEKANMKPGEIRMLLNESTGIQTQQTSATSYNSSIRIQGLDGKYTQILKDGFPLYSGFSGGLGLLQIAPLDLKQVEVIKGASSTLYGGDAIAGLINLVSKTPTAERTFDVLLNATSAYGFDASTFYAQKFKNTGTTIFASFNSGSPYDPANIGLTAIPQFTRYTLNPKLFIYFSDQTILNIGFNSTIEERIGGDIKYIEGKADSIRSYFEENNTTRLSSQIALDHTINPYSKFSLKNSVSYYDRKIEIPGFIFGGRQISSFSEGTYDITSERFEWIGGLNLWTDRFLQNKPDMFEGADQNYVTFGAFVQNTWKTTDKISLESGFRYDYQNTFGHFLLPRFSVLMKIHRSLTIRAGGGMGYKTPTIFTEDAERLQFKNVLPVDENKVKAEKSIGTNFDINYRTALTKHLVFTMNSLLFYTRVDRPIKLEAQEDDFYEFIQMNGYTDTKGVETNIKLTYDHIKLFIGYTFADVHEHFNGELKILPLVARHRLNNVLFYEVEDELRVGLEGYYFSPQKLNDGGTGRDYWIFGLMIEKMWEDYSLFINFENFLDTRQTKFGTIYNGTITNPQFKDIYAPLDGFVINGGVKIKF